jgi:hypothetical protein
MQTVAECRERAEKCRSVATRQTKPESRTGFEEIAQIWEMLADAREKMSQTMRALGLD